MKDLIGDKMKKKSIMLKYIFPHEEMDPNKLKKLTESIMYSKMLKKLPVIYKIHQSKYIILDGHHRIFALKNLGIESVPCIIVKESEIKLSSWIHKLPSSNYLWTLLLEFSSLIISDKPLNMDYLFRIKDNGKNYWGYGDLEELKKLVKTYVCKNNYIKVNEISNSNISNTFLIFKKISFLEIINSQTLFPISSTRFSVDDDLYNDGYPL